MAHVILTGCTGTAGSAVLARCIASSSISRISVLSRRPVKQAQGVGKVNVIIHKDFNVYPNGLLEQLKGAVGCVWALGISAGQVSADEYKVLTRDYPLAAAKAFAALNPLFNFVYISGEGVSTNVLLRAFRSQLMPLRLRASRVASQLSSPARKALPNPPYSLSSPKNPSLRIYNVRPAFIDDTQDAKLKEGKKPFSYALMDKMAPLLRAAWPSGVSPTGKLAEVLVRCVEEQGAKEAVERAYHGKGVSFDGEGEGVGVLIENVGLRRLAGL